MSFEPEAVRAFEHAGWQRAASRYKGTFAHATAPYIAPLLEAAEISAGQHVLDLLLGRNREAGTTLVMVTHDSQIAQRADRRIYLRDGSVVGDERSEPA